jgi:hypothetical protein
MRAKLRRVGAAVVSSAAVIVSLAAVADADPPDPHQPEVTHNYCPGGQWGYNQLRVCDGDKYPDGSYWHQWSNGGNWGDSTWHYECVDGGEPLPAPPPPGGCGGAIPPA